jgi:site-specific recombinase XerD
VFKRSGVWWTCIRHNGKKVQKSLETADRKLAKAIEAKVRTEIIEGSYFEKLVGSKKSFKDMMNKLMKEYSHKVSKATRISYSTSLTHLKPFFEETRLTNITPKMISRYKVLRINEGAKPATINRELAMLSKAFSLTVKDWEWIKENPVSKVQKEKVDNKRDRWLTKDEERKIIDNSSDWLREIVTFGLYTGLRLEEILSLEWSRVNLLRRTILIKDTKNGNPKTLPVNKIALDVLNQRSIVKCIKNDFVFFNSSGEKVSSNVLRTAFYSVLKKVGIDDCRLHDLRHSFATRLAQAGIDIYKISKLLGHKDIKMTQRYAHHCPDSLRDGVEILDTDYNLTTMDKKECSEML